MPLHLVHSGTYTDSCFAECPRRLLRRLFLDGFLTMEVIRHIARFSARPAVVAGGRTLRCALSDLGSSRCAQAQQLAYNDFLQARTTADLVPPCQP